MVVLVLAAFAVTVVVGLLRGAAGDTAELPLDTQPPPGTAAPPATTASPPEGDVARVYVHVAGAVHAPGLYALPADARAVDAVAAAGGFTAEADRSVVNLARTVSDGEQIIVPVVGAAAAPGASQGAGASSQDAVIDLNTADAAALEELPGIGPALAERILTWREENGRFASVEDLLAVPGIGEKLLEGLRDSVRV